MNSYSHALFSRLVSYLNELLYLRNGGAGEVLHGDEGVLKVRKGVVRRDLLGGEGHQVFDSLLG